MKKLKQGQTIYWVGLDYRKLTPTPFIQKVFLHSNKVKLPPPGFVIEKYPVAYVKELIARYGSKGIYFSRRKAERELKALRVQLNKQ